MRVVQKLKFQIRYLISNHVGVQRYLLEILDIRFEVVQKPFYACCTLGCGYWPVDFDMVCTITTLILFGGLNA